MKKYYSILYFFLVLNVSFFAQSASLEIVEACSSPIAQEAISCSAIVGGAVAASIVYGIASSYITTCVCKEYFTQGINKTRIMESNYEYKPYTVAKFLCFSLTAGASHLVRHEPTSFEIWERSHILGENASSMLISLRWGILTSWQTGLLAGVPLMAAARFGPWPRLAITDLLKPAGIALACVAGSSLLTGLIYYHQAATEKKAGINTLRRANEQNTGGVPREKFPHWLGCAGTHVTSYRATALAGVGFTAYTLWRRYSLR
jgi:hypothetical protein